MDQHVHHQGSLCFRHKTEGIYRPLLKFHSGISHAMSLEEHNSEAQDSLQQSLNMSS